MHSTKTLVAAVALALAPMAHGFELTSTDIQAGKPMPKAQEYQGFGCDGANISPQLAWRDAPEGTKSFAVTAYDPDAPTGNWNARIKAGGAVFEKILKIETVMPNRLKINVDFGKDIQSLSGGRINGTLSAAWLHGAVARNLKSDMGEPLSYGLGLRFVMDIRFDRIGFYHVN